MFRIYRVILITYVSYQKERWDRKKRTRQHKHQLLAETTNLFFLYSYQDPEALEINTLENAIYMGMKNDLSFLIDNRLSLYEHQSMVNPNMPLRLLDLYTVRMKEIQLELTAVLLNINRNHKRELMESWYTVNH